VYEPDTLSGSKRGSPNGRLRHGPRMKAPCAQLCLLLSLSGVWSSCAEVRGRHHARKGNRLYLEGNYRAALSEFRRAEQLLPAFPVIALNTGLTCRQLMIPGARTRESETATECALGAFERLKRLRPDDPRGEQLFVQTLFDADRFETLAAMYERQLRTRPDDLSALNGLIQVYSRWDQWPQALAYMVRRAHVQASDAEAQYAVGVFIWNRLFQKGGNGEKATFDPRADPKPIPPPFGSEDVTGEERITLADQGISFLERALSLRPNYGEAMVYVNLLYRQKSYGFFADPQAFQACIEAAERWRQKATVAESSHSKIH
jgi:tetratricopeptide (TPR) repeat protein